MSRDPRIENNARLMVAFHFGIRAGPTDLRCADCKSILVDACQVSCGCRFCRRCIDSMEESGSRFCPGDSPQCREAALSTAAPDDMANTSISRLSFKCPLRYCDEECALADMEDHLRTCPSKSAARPVPDGQQQARHERSRWRERVMKWVLANFNIGMERVERELALKEEQKRGLKREMRRAQNVNQSMESQLKSLKRQMKVLRERRWQLEEDLHLEMQWRDEPGPFDYASCTALSGGPSADWSGILAEMEWDDYRSARGGADPVISQQVPAGPRQGDTSYFEWLIGVPVGETQFGHEVGRSSDRWVGQARPYAFELGANNNITVGWLNVWLRVHAPPADSPLQWPMAGAVTVTVSDRRRRAASTSQTGQCVVEKPKERGFRVSDEFLFQHSDLRAAGLRLELGVRVSCLIVHNEGQ